EAPDSLGEAPDEVADTTEPEISSEDAIDTPLAEPLVAPETPGQAPETEVVAVETPNVSVSEDAAPEIDVSEDTAPQPEPALEEEPAPLIIIHDTPATGEETDVAALPDTDAPEISSEPDAAPQVIGQIDAPQEPTGAEQSDGPSLPWLDQLRRSQIDEAPTAPTAPNVAVEPSLPPVGTAAPEAPVVADAGDDDAVSAAVDAALDEVASAEREVAQADTATDGSEEVGSFLQPVETFTDRDNTEGAVGTGTLPVVRRLGDSSSEAEVPEPDGGEDTVAEAADPEVEEQDTDGPALQVFGTAFDPQNDLPLVSIVLVHEGSEPLSGELLEILPQNIAFAVNASLSGAAGIAQAYRSVGREVVMIPSLPAGAEPQDIEQALGANFDLVPEAVAVMDVSGASFQSDRAAVEQVVDVVSASGHGIITFPRGLNPAHQAAQRAGVPTGLIFRNLDGAAETQEQIRRSLDRAAFRARQDEAVILVGTTGSTMLSALSDWVLGSRAESVTLAPISAALGG
ncbi:MAG: divergent polysaccharide deacetylase family protein, partial [Pseudomonadota bacterium]